MELFGNYMNNLVVLYELYSTWLVGNYTKPALFYYHKVLPGGDIKKDL